MEKAKTELGGALSGTVSRQIPYLFSSSLYSSGFLVDSDHCLICLEWIWCCTVFLSCFDLKWLTLQQEMIESLVLNKCFFYFLFSREFDFPPTVSGKWRLLKRWRRVSEEGRAVVPRRNPYPTQSRPVFNSRSVVLADTLRKAIILSALEPVPQTTSLPC